MASTKRRDKRDVHYAEMEALSAANPGEYRDGFIAGFLQAYRDTNEYACSVRRATIAHGEHLNDGHRDDPPVDVEGW